MFFWMRHLPLLAFALLTSFGVKAGAAVKATATAKAVQVVPSMGGSPQFKSYREWKTERIQGSQLKVSSIKNQIEQRKASRQMALGVDPNLAHQRAATETQMGWDANLEKLERQLQTEQYDLELAKDLSVTDYFVGYLTKVQDKRSAINEVAGKLSPEEVAELMTAYANSVFGAHTSDLPASASNVPKDQVK